MFWLKNFETDSVIADFGSKYEDKEKLKALLRAQQDTEPHIIELKQIHSDSAVLITEDNLDKDPLDADGMVTKLKNVALVIRTADCYPLLFFDPRKRIIGAAHSGREGTRKNISRQTILLMQKLGANPADIKAAIGPGITAPNYPVDEDTWQNFCTSTAVSQRFPFLDLRKVLYRQLINAGIKNHNIFNLSYCTFSDPFYYSWRQNKTKNRQFSWVMLR